MQRAANRFESHLTCQTVRYTIRQAGVCYAKRNANKREVVKFKKHIIEITRQEGLSYSATARISEIKSHRRAKDRERICLTEKPEDFTIARRGLGSTGRSKKLSKAADESLPAEAQRLRAENACLTEHGNGDAEKIPFETRLLLHADRSWQDQHKRTRGCFRKSIRDSINREGNCLDNGCYGNFFVCSKVNSLICQRLNPWNTSGGNSSNIDYCNNRRIKAKLKGLPSAIHRRKPFRLLKQFLPRMIA